MDRRNSTTDDQEPRPTGNPNVFDDEYALDPAEEDYMPGVSDGFRPTNNGISGDRHDHDREREREPSPARPSFAAQHSTDGDLRRFASRNSTAKVPCARESISHDIRHAGTHTRGVGSQATPLQHHTSISSTGSFATMARSESPFGTGPSHPYGMYPQNTMARSSSVTTSSTQPQPHRSVSLQRPTHPYGMYPQNVVEDQVEAPVPPVPAAIPVGFPGLNTGFHRQIGPDGEEQDIIGPDGHTEQLPPYSRYPEEGPTKAALAAEASSTPVETVPAPLSTSNDALVSPVEHQAQPQEEPPREPPATREPQTSEQGASEKQEHEKAPKGWTSRKLWGKVPLGVALVLLVLVLVFAIILGAAIGTFVAKNKKDDHGNNKHKDKDNPSPQVTGPSGSMFDAYTIPVPSSLPPLPTGAFALPLGVAQEASPGCLPMANQLSAWSCKMTFVPLLLNMSYLPPSPTVSSGTQPQPVATMQPYTKPDGGIQWGVQPPSIPSQALSLVMDNDYKAYGPAYHFQTRYDKIVVLSPEEFSAGASLRKRNQGPKGGDGDNKAPFRHRFQVMPGETPWYCVWNQTFIEMYIYVTDNSTAATFTAFPSVWPSNNPFQSSIPTEATSTPTSLGGSAAPSTTFGSVTAPNTPSPTPLHRRGDSDYPHLLPYPRIVKIEERRLPGAPQPYCQKMRLLDNGAVVPEMNGSGAPIKVLIQEDDPSLEEFLLSAGGPPPNPSATSNTPNNNSNRRRDLAKRRDPAGACHCQWMFQ
ncbi:uncharacterized protein BDR25DRAFT_129549 [Lindgomyces ingoldianus]|uniref:Uncharacterized protein n=1 Tax=Lindgomyces ingoldianus TaxID=673940 RepID=A0ACB6R436_9PLEO|nr:uncharacterized protein BDR25DRAFT_129549 [Lindgomyces ingoldianus]KAF2473196.1 hypothetical protein BDR25DRAFT_129549 [Lindgomyces ingoldianus]